MRDMWGGPGTRGGCGEESFQVMVEAEEGLVEAGGARSVLHVITALGRGGAENHLVDLVRHQRAEGRRVAVAHLRADAYWRAALEQCGAEVHGLGLQYYGEPGPCLRLARLLRRGGFDLVHAHLPPAELYARAAMLGVDGVRLPLVISKHNDEPFCRMPGERWMARWTAGRARRVIAISHAVARYMEGPSAGIERGKLRVVHYGIDPARMVEREPGGAAALRRLWGVGEDALVIGFVGRLVPQKDLGTLLRAFALFARGHPEARLVMVGVGPLEEELRRLAGCLGIEGATVWAGFREDVGEVMRALDVLALTSLYEGFGLVLLEAMAAWRPVVASAVSAVPEVVEDGVTGLLAPVGRPEAFASAFERMVDAPLRHRMGEEAARRVSREFSLSKMGALTDAVYAEALREEEEAEEIGALVGLG